MGFFADFDSDVEFAFGCDEKRLRPNLRARDIGGSRLRGIADSGRAHGSAMRLNR
jgi:hypothetical protein